jgi:pimeloyl-ACP methyl ester carboxylesterase
MSAPLQIARAGTVRLAYQVRGQGPTILLIMGLGGRAADWNDAFLARMAEGFEAVTFDNRGTGASDRPDEEYTLDVMADEAVAVLDALGRPRAHVVGVSMGGMIAQLVALRHPESVDRLALLSTHAGGPGAIPPTPLGMTALMADRSRPPADMVRDAMTAITAPGFAERDPGAIAALVDLALAQPTPPATFARQMNAIMGSDRSDRLGSIRAPTLVVHGTEDPLVPPGNGAILARGIPGARLVELPGIGHLPMWECPARLATLLTEFLAATG